MPTALMAGAATGIGLATSRRLIEAGWRIQVADIAADRAAAAYADVPSDQISIAECDLSDPKAAAELVSATVERYGELTSLVVCAGMLVERELADFTVEEWDQTMALNLRAPFLLAQHAAPHLAATGVGRIVLTGSTAAFRGGGGSFAYAASKGGLVALVRSLAVALGPSGVSVNCVCPGWIDTPFNDPYWSRVGGDRADAEAALTARIPRGVLGQPDDVAGLMAFLASADAGYITGQSFAVDGGLLAS